MNVNIWRRKRFNSFPCELLNKPQNADVSGALVVILTKPQGLTHARQKAGRERFQLNAEHEQNTASKTHGRLRSGLCCRRGLKSSCRCLDYFNLIFLAVKSGSVLEIQWSGSESRPTATAVVCRGRTLTDTFHLDRGRVLESQDVDFEEFNFKLGKS